MLKIIIIALRAGMHDYIYMALFGMVPCYIKYVATGLTIYYAVLMTMIMT